MDKNTSIENFIRMAAPVEWWEYSQELKVASEELWKLNSTSFISIYSSDVTEITQRPSVSRTYMLIIGISLENMIKGLLISEESNYLKDGRLDPAISSGHNLYDLSNKVKIFKFTETEQNLLKILSGALPNWGKYPVPKKFDQIVLETHSTPEFRIVFLDLYSKLERAIFEMTKSGWNGPNNVHIGGWSSSHLKN